MVGFLRPGVKETEPYFTLVKGVNGHPDFEPEGVERGGRVDLRQDIRIQHLQRALQLSLFECMAQERRGGWARRLDWNRRCGVENDLRLDHVAVFVDPAHKERRWVTATRNLRRVWPIERPGDAPNMRGVLGRGVALHLGIDPFLKSSGVAPIGSAWRRQSQRLGPDKEIWKLPAEVSSRPEA